MLSIFEVTVNFKLHSLPGRSQSAVSWCNEALCWCSEKETALLTGIGPRWELGVWSGSPGNGPVCLCMCVCAQALFLTRKLRPNCPLHCLIPPDGFLKWVLDSKFIPFAGLFFFFLNLGNVFFTVVFFFYFWKHGNDLCRIILMERKKNRN